ncbi:MAG: aminopeptidase [bacterium]|nr:aminopeptidase [bacterium]
MADPRHQKLAKVLVHYSLAVKPGEKVLLTAPTAAAPLFTECYREFIRAGAHVTTRLLLPELREILLKEASDEQLTYVSDLDRIQAEYYDASLYIIADENTRQLSGVDPKRNAMRRAAFQPVNKIEDDRAAAGTFRWCLTLFPTHAHAQDAGMSLSDYEEFVYGAGLLHMDDPVQGWLKQHEEQQRIVDYLQQHDEIHIVTPTTDITYRVGGRKWMNADGKVNFPDGEVFSAPIEDSVNGTVHFTYPAIYDGHEVEDVRLTFKDGVVVEATASKGEAFLLATIDTDAGSRRLGEVAFGTNYGIQRFSRELLFDEKIGGTMHMALGSTYPETGGVNESGLHWDMVCDLKEGRVYADGQVCYENGKFVI